MSGYTVLIIYRVADGLAELTVPLYAYSTPVLVI